jgi:hypothetical protein
MWYSLSTMDPKLPTSTAGASGTAATGLGSSATNTVQAGVLAAMTGRAKEYWAQVLKQVQLMSFERHANFQPALLILNAPLPAAKAMDGGHGPDCSVQTSKPVRGGFVLGKVAFCRSLISPPFLHCRHWGASKRTQHTLG